MQIKFFLLFYLFSFAFSQPSFSKGPSLINNVFDSLVLFDCNLDGTLEIYRNPPITNSYHAIISIQNGTTFNEYTFNIPMNSGATWGDFNNDGKEKNSKCYIQTLNQIFVIR